MKKLIVLVIVLIAIGAGLPLFSTWSKAVTRAKFLKIRDGNPAMTIEQVETLLGRPAHIDASESTGLTGEAYQYPIATGEMKIVFVNGVVFHAEFVPGAKS